MPRVWTPTLGEGLSLKENWNVIDPGDEQFRTQSLHLHFVVVHPNGRNDGHGHQNEALFYVLEGNGYTEIEGTEYRWQPGDIFHVPPAMFEHEHYNDTDEDYRLLRIQFGIRFWFTDIWPEGYESRRIYDAEGRPIIAGWIERERER